jgi:hypothetical protein
MLRIDLESLYWIEENHLSWGLWICFEKFPGIAVKKTAVQNVQAILRKTVWWNRHLYSIRDPGRWVIGQAPDSKTGNCHSDTVLLCQKNQSPWQKSLKYVAHIWLTANEEYLGYKSRRHFWKRDSSVRFSSSGFFISGPHLGSCWIY